MIFRLMAMILITSDTGSVSMSTMHTDWPTEMQCRQVLQTHYTEPPPREFNGHTVTAKISASCVPVNPPVMASDVPPPPPPVAEILPRIFGPMLAPPCGGRLPCDYN